MFATISRPDDFSFRSRSFVRSSALFLFTVILFPEFLLLENPLFFVDCSILLPSITLSCGYLPTYLFMLDHLVCLGMVAFSGHISRMNVLFNPPSKPGLHSMFNITEDNSGWLQDSGGSGVPVENETILITFIYYIFSVTIPVTFPYGLYYIIDFSGKWKVCTWGALNHIRCYTCLKTIDQELMNNKLYACHNHYIILLKLYLMQLVTGSMKQ